MPSEAASERPTGLVLMSDRDRAVRDVAVAGLPGTGDRRGRQRVEDGAGQALGAARDQAGPKAGHGARPRWVR